MFIKFEIQDVLVLAVKWYLLFYSWRGSAAKHWDLSPKLWDQKFNHSHSRREPYAIDERSVDEPSRASCEKRLQAAAAL